MKKFILEILVVCLVIAVVVGFGTGRNSQPSPVDMPDVAAEPAAEPEVSVIGGADGPTSVYVKNDSETEEALAEEPAEEAAEAAEPAEAPAEAVEESAVAAAAAEPEAEAAEPAEAPAEAVEESAEVAAEPEAETVSAEEPVEEAAEAIELSEMPAEAEEEPAAAAAALETVSAEEPAEEAAEAAELSEAPSTVPDEPTVASGRLNYEALYGLYAPEEKVLSVNDREEQWGDYFYILFTQCGQIEDYFNSMAAYYGMQFGWADPIEEEGGDTFADAALESAENLMIQLGALEAFAEENGVEVSEEMRAMIEAQKQQDVISALGEEGTMEAFEEYLETIHLSKEMYDRVVTQNFLYQESFNALYGENAEKLSDETALKYLEDNGYVSAAHILLLNTDEETGEALDEAALSEKKAELEAVIEELRAIEDNEERKAAFLQKAAEISEDPGNAYYPEGYTFTSGTMVTEFEDAANALEDYAVSDVVETSYGYHILMRLPLSPDAIVEFNSSTGAPRTARMLAANQEYAEKLQQKAAELELSWLPGHEAPDLMSYVAE